MAVWQKSRSSLRKLTKKALSTWSLQKNPLHGRFLNFFTRDGDFGAVTVDRYGSFVGFYSAGNDYTGAGYFIPADRLFADIKCITKASDVEVL